MSHFFVSPGLHRRYSHTKTEAPPAPEAAITVLRATFNHLSGNFVPVIGSVTGVPTGTIEYGLPTLTATGGGTSIALNGLDGYITFADDPSLRVALPGFNLYFQIDSLPAVKYVLLSKDGPGVPGGISIEALLVGGAMRLTGYKSNAAGTPLYFNNAQAAGVADLLPDVGYKLTMSTAPGSTFLFLNNALVGTIPDGTGWELNDRNLLVGAYTVNAQRKTDGVFDQLDIVTGPFTTAQRTTLPTAVTISHADAAPLVDDTFASFNEFTGPVIQTISGNQGYANFSYGTSDAQTLTAQSRLDLRNATFRHRAADGSPHYQFNVGGNWQNPPDRAVAIVGGLWIGEEPLNSTYDIIKPTGSKAIQINSDGGIVDGVRLYNTHEDAITVTHGEGGARVPHAMSYVKNCWIDLTLADGIENDHVANLTVDDCLMDRVQQAISIDPGGQYNGNGQEANNLLVITNCLLRNRSAVSEGTRNFSGWVKTRTTSGGNTCPRTEIHNTLLAMEGWPTSFSVTSGPPARWALFLDRLEAASNNEILWLLDTAPPWVSHPSSWPAHPAGFTLRTGATARAIWEAAKQNWINSHPNVRHAPGDPAAVPANATAGYGSGGA